MGVAVLGHFLPGEGRSMSKPPSIETPEPQRLMVVCYPQQQIRVIAGDRTYRHLQNFFISHRWVAATAPVSFVCFPERVSPRSIYYDKPIFLQRYWGQIWN